MPLEPWLHNLGRVDEERKHAVLGAARALVQLSQQESLSLVALEAWAQETPVIVHRGCAVLAGQVQRSQGGTAVGEYADFARALDELLDDPASGRERGLRGREYVRSRYASEKQFVARLEGAIADLDVPLRDRMRRRGLERAAMCDRGAWRDALGRIVENLLDADPRPCSHAIDAQPLRDQVHVSTGTRTTLVPVRVHNRGTHAAIADGQARTRLVAEVRAANGGNVVGVKVLTDLPGLLVPGATQTAMLLVPVPPQAGSYDLHVGTEHPDGPNRRSSATTHVLLHVGQNDPDASSGLAPLLDGIRPLLLQARQAQRLPDDYVDVTEGWLARWKRWTKKTLLNNFKLAYVDVMSRQQSHVNQQLVAAVEQLAECCATLDHAVRIQQSRIAEFELSRGQPPVNGGDCVQPGRMRPVSGFPGGSDA
jgi:Glycosyl transferases group 1